jgi:hypothetical protein
MNPTVTAVTNATLVALAGSLAALQSNLQQTLPVLTLFNDNFDFVSLGDNGVGSTGAAIPPGNFGVNSAGPMGRPLVNAAANQSTPAAGALPGGSATVPMTRDTLRVLLVLQSDIQRMLPIVNALNAGTTNFPGNFTNLFGVVPTGP